MSIADETTPFRRIDLEVMKLYVNTVLDRYSLTHLAPGCYTDKIINEVANNLVYRLSLRPAG